MPPPLLDSRARLLVHLPTSHRLRSRRPTSGAAVVVVKLRGCPDARVRDVVRRVVELHVDMGAPRRDVDELRVALTEDDAFFDAWCRGMAGWCPLAAEEGEATGEEGEAEAEEGEVGMHASSGRSTATSAKRSRTHRIPRE